MQWRLTRRKVPYASKSRCNQMQLARPPPCSFWRRWRQYRRRVNRYPFTQVDVFGTGPYRGNSLAVVGAADGIPDEAMQRFASWTNLSETTFLLEPSTAEADYRVRIFTSTRELPFAGHPSLGSAHAWLAAGGQPKTPGVVVQECGAGLIPIRHNDDRLAFAAPPLSRFEPLDHSLVERVAAGLGIDPSDILDSSWLVNGPEWIGVRLAGADQVLSLTIDPIRLDGLAVGVIGPQPAGADSDFEVRAFVPGDAMPEDPVTGSLNAGFAYWLIRAGAPSTYVAAQGTAIGRAGRVHIELDGDTIWIGGQVHPSITGTVDI